MNILMVLYYIALILGFQASAFFTFFLIAEGGADLLEGKTSVLPILIMMIIAVAGYVWTLVKPGPGSIIMITGGVLMMIYLLFLSGIGGWQMALIYGLPFIIPGIVFYLTKNKVKHSEL